MNFVNLMAIDKNYVSEIDKFLMTFDKTSLSQQKEIKKHERIFKLRDKPETIKKSKLWKAF